MKLLFCTTCEDIVRLKFEQHTCMCGEVGGHYIDRLNAVYFGEGAIPLGIKNDTLSTAIVNQPQNGLGERFTAFVIPKDCPTYQKIHR